MHRFYPYARPGTPTYGLLYMTHRDSIRDSPNNDPQDRGDLWEDDPHNPLAIRERPILDSADNPLSRAPIQILSKSFMPMDSAIRHTFSFNRDAQCNTVSWSATSDVSHVEEVDLVTSAATTADQA